MSRVSIKDVAKEASVSTATVSHVVNGTRFVAESTTIRVKQAMKNLGYTPNFAAKTLRSQKTSTIGIVLPDIGNHFFTSVVKEIESVLGEQQYQLLVGNTNEDIETERKKIQAFISQQVSGLIIASSAKHYSEIAWDIPDDLPIVFIDRLPEETNQSSIVVDNEKGVQMAIEQFIQSGHQNIGLITGIHSLSTTKDRIKGYKLALAKHGLPFSTNLIYNGNSKFESGYKGCEHLLGTTNASALFVANNLMSVGAMTYLTENDIAVPDDVAIIGFDDYRWAEITSPPLTVIKQPVEEIGAAAATELLEQIELGQPRNKPYRFETELILRSSHHNHK
ncbi:LacI family DNA-binding transcriptional regulator [Shouchella lehensis]|uniref:Transcriptional repressor n=1 Tax=Shouchella lehensis G1 TaxID=1246626 RepID=A0A060LXG3_9BACI|nr:LacI family DNA-binding transcriptional regulator [Shouchella lehensis]AIC95956.1 transcriptional repressor [Shouchella lehensis G1]